MTPPQEPDRRPEPEPNPRPGLDGPLEPTPLQELADERLRRAGVRLLLKRDDLIDPGVPGSGTKWRKLLPNARAARAAGHDTLLTFGGAYSHHLRATAAAGRRFGLRTVGVVRGEELRDRPLNPGLARAAAWGMHLDFIDRVTWRLRDTPRVLAQLHERHGPAYVLPEGGSNALGVRGCRTVTEELNSQAPEVDVVCCSVGTGGMLAGVAAGLRPGQRALGFAALKPGPALDLDAETAALQRLAFGARRGSWHIDHRYHFGGYGRATPELKAFAARVADSQEVEPALDLDLTYEAKALYGLLELAERGTFRRGTTLALIIAG